MESKVEDSRPSSPFYSMNEEQSFGSLNDACILSDSELLNDDPQAFDDFSLIVPETPRYCWLKPQLVKYSLLNWVKNIMSNNYIHTTDF